MEGKVKKRCGMSLALIIKTKELHEQGYKILDLYSRCGDSEFWEI